MENINPPFRRRYHAQARAALIAKFGQSGLTIDQFAEQHQLNPRTFRQWLYRAKKTTRPKRPAPVFQELPVSALAAQVAWTAEVQLANGLAIKLGPGCDVHWVGELVQRLGHRC